jgi:hypothetical protein
MHKCSKTMMVLVIAVCFKLQDIMCRDYAVRSVSDTLH